MSGYYNTPEDLDADEREITSGGGLRKQLEEALRMNKKLVDELSSERRVKTATEVLEGAGLDPALSAIIPQDQDPKTWVEQYGQLLGANRVAAPATEVPTEVPVVAAVDLDPAVEAERLEAQRQQEAMQAGSSLVTQTDIDRINAITSEADLLAEIAKAQKAADLMGG